MDIITDKYRDHTPPFISWLITQTERDDLIGTLAADTKRFIEDGTLKPSADYYEIVDIIKDNFDLDFFKIKTPDQTPEKVRKKIEAEIGRPLHKNVSTPVSPLLCLELAFDEYDQFIKRKKFKRISKSKSTNGYVYFVGLLDMPNHIKIGFTVNLAKRLLAIQTSSPFEIFLIGFIQTDNYASLEKEIHKHFIKSHIMREWFSISQTEIKTIIDKHNGKYINASC